MQSFKQYLTETTGSMEIKFYFFQGSIRHAEIKRIEQEVPNINSVGGAVTYHSVFVKVTENVTDEYINKVIDSIKQVAPNAKFLKQGNTGRIICDSLPTPFTISTTYPVVIKQAVSLKDIDKSIISANYIEFVDLYKIKSNVLGLFKIKELKLINEFQAPNLSNNEWVKIVNKHLNGNRDIFDCKEELVNAGYKEYAKL